jgi:trehalose-6-phosphate synthase
MPPASTFSSRAPSLVLATDLDGTFLGGDQAQRTELYTELHRRREELMLIYATGRDLEFIAGLFAHLSFPTPQEYCPMPSDLVIVSHRQPFEEVVVDGSVEYRENTSPNGIVPTAWKHVEQDGDEVENRHVTMHDRHGDYEVLRAGLTPEQVSSFYHATSKASLWPVLHSFAQHFDAEAADDALIWVHDDNLWLVPGYIREIKPSAKVAFFHHTPFPSSDLFTLLPWRDEIMDSLLACDIVGFHIRHPSAQRCQSPRSPRSCATRVKPCISMPGPSAPTPR